MADLLAPALTLLVIARNLHDRADVDAPHSWYFDPDDPDPRIDKPNPHSQVRHAVRQ